MTREEIQSNAVKRARNSYLLILEWCTGLGKSKAAIEIMRSMADPMVKKDILLVVAEISHKNNWKEEFTKWNLNSLEFDIIIETYASLKNHKGEEYDLIILDEAHHAKSDLRTEILSTIKASKILALTATMPPELWYILCTLARDRPLFTHKVTLAEAISYGILPEPKVYLIPMVLDNNKSNQLIIEGWGLKSKRKTINCTLNKRWVYIKDKVNYPNVSLEIECTELQKYIYLSKQIEFWKKRFFSTGSEVIKNKWLQFGSERKRYLGSLKDEKAQDLLNLLKNKRYICFCSSIEQAEKLGKSTSIHSKKKGALPTIESFNRKDINTLFTVGMLQEGQNLIDIEAGVIIQLDGQERAFIQKLGRVMRAEYPIIFILYYKDTRDEEYLTKALKDVDPNYITEVKDVKTLII